MLPTAGHPFSSYCNFIEKNIESKDFLTAPVTKSSKHRRELINQEIDHIRTLLSLQSRSLQRLSQLEVMSMACIFIRRCHILGSVISHGKTYNDIMKAVPGFFLVCTAQGKLVYISDNITDFLGHSMVDITKQGDNIYDIIDKKDHNTVRQSLEATTGNEVNFRCRISLSRYTRRQPSFFDEKPIQVSGYFVSPAISTNSPSDRGHVMVALCTPILSPALRVSTVNQSLMTFTSIHTMDMKFVEASSSCSHYLGYEEEQLVGRSWYDFIAPDFLGLAAKHHIAATEGMLDSHTVFYGEFMNKYGTKFPVAVSLQQHKTDDETIHIVNTVQVLRESTFLDNQSYMTPQNMEHDHSPNPLSQRRHSCTPPSSQQPNLSPGNRQQYSPLSVTASQSLNRGLDYNQYPAAAALHLMPSLYPGMRQMDAHTYDPAAAAAPASYQQNFLNRFPFGAHQSYESYCQPQQPLQTSHSPNTESRSAHSQSPVQYTDLTNYSQGHKKQQQQSTVSHHSDEDSSGRQRQYPRYQSSPEQERAYLQKEEQLQNWVPSNASTDCGERPNTEPINLAYNPAYTAVPYHLTNDTHSRGLPWQMV